MNDDFTRNKVSNPTDPETIPCRKPVRRASRTVSSFSERNTTKKTDEIKVETVPVEVLEKLLFDNASPKIVEEALQEKKRAEEAERARLEEARARAAERARIEREKAVAAEKARLEKEHTAALERAKADREQAIAAEKARLAQIRAKEEEEERLALARAEQLKAERRHAAEQLKAEQSPSPAPEKPAEGSPEAVSAPAPKQEEAPEAKEKEEKEKVSAFVDAFDWIKSFLFSLTVVIFVFTLIFRGVTVNGGSMLPTLEDKNYLIISDLLYTPKTGDIVVVQTPRYKDAKEPLIKRVIATGGQTVKINFNTWEVWVDGKLLNEDYILRDAATTMNSEDLRPDENGEAEIRVEKGCIFVMGDHRNDSLDSRSNSVGQIDERYIMGRVLLRLTPLENFGKVD